MLASNAKEKAARLQSILSRYGPLAPPVVWSSEAALMPVVAASKVSGQKRREYCCRGQQTASHGSLPETGRYQRPMIHFAPTTVCQIAAVATANSGGQQGDQVQDPILLERAREIEIKAITKAGTTLLLADETSRCRGAAIPTGAQIS
jgi:hypothetical protein